jgi:biopolymer transport protein ExbD
MDNTADNFLEDLPEENVEIGLTPLIDVIFQLLVFFMLTSTFALPSLEVDLPSANVENRQQKEHDILIEINAKGIIHMNGKRVDTSISQTIQTLELDPNLMTASLRADRSTDYETVTRVMAELGENHISKLHFIIEPEATIKAR